MVYDYDLLSLGVIGDVLPIWRKGNVAGGGDRMSLLKRIKLGEKERMKRSVKAKDIKEIHCEAHNHRYVRCPRNERGHKYRGVVKCWGCSFAFWAGTRYSYGHKDKRWRPR